MTNPSSLSSFPSPSVLLSYPPCILFALPYMYVKVTLCCVALLHNVHVENSSEQAFWPAQER